MSANDASETSKQTVLFWDSVKLFMWFYVDILVFANGKSSQQITMEEFGAIASHQF